MPRKTKVITNTSYEATAMTPVEYGGLQAAYDHLNRELFDGALCDVFITYQRRSNMRGYFSSDRYSARTGDFRRDELALNPDAFLSRSDEEICSTLVHEMVHVWQAHHGLKRPKRGNYHNQEWGSRLKAVGLHPSSSGMVGGRETGSRVSHYVIPGGAFTESFARLAATGWKLNLQSAMSAGPQGRKDPSKTKFTCPACGQNAWGKPELAVDCRICGVAMIPAKAPSASESTATDLDALDVLEPAE